MSKARKRDSDSESGSDDEDGDKPSLVSTFPALKPHDKKKSAPATPSTPAVPKPAAAAAAPADAVAPTTVSTTDELYTWSDALKLAKDDLEKLYGTMSSVNPLPFRIRSIFGDMLCPTKEGQDFYLPAEDINMENVKAYYDSIIKKLKSTLTAAQDVTVVDAWYSSVNKRGLVKAFQQTSPLMQEEIRVVVERFNRQRLAEPMATPSKPPQEDQASGTKRKAESEQPAAANPPSEAPVKRQQVASEEPPVYASLSDFRRRQYARPVPIAAPKNHHDARNNEGYDITSMLEATRYRADVGERKVEVVTYKNRMLPF